MADYEAVAKSKRAGEDSLRAYAKELSARGISLVIVSGDLIEGTITPRLLQRQVPGLIEARRQEAGGIANSGRVCFGYRPGSDGCFNAQRAHRLRGRYFLAGEGVSPKVMVDSAPNFL